MGDGLAWLESLHHRGIKPGLERMRAAVDPSDLGFPVIQVAGTNGKGSVCHLLDSILREDGYTVGRYTSPHLQEVKERIAVNGRPISPAALDREAAALRREDIGFTYFEALTVIALRHFQGRKVDMAVLEVGMGGRLDATSVADAHLAVITTIALEHERYLGSTIPAIAAEKAGIIKPGSHVVTGCTGEALEMVRQRARTCGAPLLVVGEDVTWRQTGLRRFTVRGRRTYDLTTRLDGRFQGSNVALAVAAAELLEAEEGAIVRGVAAAAVPGRMERRGRFLLDGAHNPAAMRALREALCEVPYEQLVIVLGIMEDKNIPGILEELPPGEVVATRASTPRAASPRLLARHLAAAGRPCMVAGDVRQALQVAGERAGEEDLVLVTGSLYLVGEARSLLPAPLSSPR